jgi:hypothetical protein
MLRKCILTGALVLFGRGSIAQTFLALLISFIFFTAQIKYFPYRERVHSVRICVFSIP